MAQFLVYFWRRAAQLRTSESGSIYGGHQQLPATINFGLMLTHLS